MMENTTIQKREVSLGVYPPVTKIVTIPKAKVVSPISVFNNTNDTLKLDIVFRAFRASDAKNGSIQYYSSEDTPANDAVFLSTVKIEDNNQQVRQINLYPNESRTLNIVFPDPKDNNDHYFSVIFLNKRNAEKTNESLVNIATGVAGNVLVTKNSDKNNNTVITPEFKTQNIVLTGPVKLNLTLSNNSDHFISISGNAGIYNLFGNKMGNIPLKPAIILSNSSRIMTDTNTATGKAQDIVWNEKFMFGYYTVKAIVKINQSSTQTYETHFFAIPVFILLIFTLFLFIVLSILFRTLRKLNFKEN